MSFKYVDLFAGIGGFHGALSALGGTCVYASEIDKAAARIYLRNWGIAPAGDITQAANDYIMDVPEHDVLVGGFPCQPFSKSGKQQGMDEARGTLFWNIAKIIEKRKPKIVLLENVRNITGPRHRDDWKVIIRTLRKLGYSVSEKPFVVSPHEIHPNHGGRPQHRERVLICATLIPLGVRSANIDPGIPDLELITHNWRPNQWKLARDLPLENIRTKKQLAEYGLSDQENIWLDAWEDFVQTTRLATPVIKIPGFPLWTEYWKSRSEIQIPRDTPEWKKTFILKNIEFYVNNKMMIDAWLKRWDGLRTFPSSRRKFEWQAQDAKSLNETIVHFRPSGVRCKPASYTPTLVAINQTTVLVKKRRKLSVREAARLQGFPEWFDFTDQPNSVSYKQLGNAVNIGVIYNVMKAQVVRDLELLGNSIPLVKAILGASDSPDSSFESFGSVDAKRINTSKNSFLTLVKEDSRVLHESLRLIN